MTNEEFNAQIEQMLAVQRQIQESDLQCQQELRIMERTTQGLVRTTDNLLRAAQSGNERLDHLEIIVASLARSAQAHIDDGDRHLPQNDA
ncbi:hypothetical protein C1752_01372 [Acaryochloris thomasi RCC1774]|uniref:Uncharacterized protein n=1 Tax=Acaryochloris thomasi RCC1774 TaxID=1764569 RepID=A0A2W1JXY2_9CYAN|nr:hypothetical protein [Acaryochloris thomasi]PZD74414.1 hypothetical protein C1752_01372 [Acaryochloris thomasi RCC1774]